MSGGRSYAPTTKTPATPSVSPFGRSRSELVPEPARDAPSERDGQHSTVAAPLAVSSRPFSFATIPLYSREERAALDELESSRSAGNRVDPQTERFLALRGISSRPPRPALLPGAVLQAKLEVGAADDPLEEEADRIADRVMGSAAPREAGERRGAENAASGAGVVQRACAACDEKEEPIRREASGSAQGSPAVPSSVGSVLASPGAPLDSGARAFLEPRFGHSFAHVRVHDGPLASESAAGVGARAYTVGSHVVFRSGAYAPTTPDGRRLLAHELAHVVQQGGEEPARIQRKADQALAWWHMRGPAVLEAKRGLNRYHEQERAAGRPGFGPDWKPLTEDDYLDDRVPPVLGTFQRQRRLHHQDRRVWQETLDALRDTSPAAPAPAPDTQPTPPPAPVQETAAPTAATPPPQAQGAAPTEDDHPEDAKVSLGVLDDSAFGFVAGQVLGDTPWAVFREFLRGAKAGLLSAPPEQIAGIVHKFTDAGIGDQWDYAKGALLGVFEGLWSSVKGLFEAVWTLIKLPYDVGEFLVVTLPELAAKYGPRIAKFLSEGPSLQDRVKEALATFFRDPKKVLDQVSTLIDAMKAAALGQVRSLGRGAAGKLLAFLGEPWFQFGRDVGNVVGQILFEVILAVASDFIGNVVKEAVAVAGQLAARAAEGIMDTLRTVGRVLRRALGWLDTIGSKLLEGAGEVLGGLKGFLQSFVEMIEGLLAEAGPAAETAEGIRVPVPKAGAPVLESRAVRPPGGAKVADLTPPKVHPTNVAKEAEGLGAGKKNPAGNAVQEATPTAAPEVTPAHGAIQPGAVGSYPTKIKWGVQEVPARPAGPGFWGKRTVQSARVDAYELKINPNNESFYLPHPRGGFVQFENAVAGAVEDGKLILETSGRSFYRDFLTLPPFAQSKILGEATRQVEAAAAVGLRVEWKVSDPIAVTNLRSLFSKEGVKILVTHLAE
ncbi:MAG TPA: DUF4157 domain-containing protein [Polyangiaceae bacterium]|jgi:hypothetical protein